MGLLWPLFGASFTRIIEAMKNISDELAAIAVTLDLIYVRALNAGDLNQTLQGVKVEKPLLVYANLATAEFPDINTNFQYYETDVKIFILDISKLPDPTAIEIDDQLSPLFTLGNFVYDALTQSDLIFLGANVERGTMSAAESIELTDEVLNGWELDLVLPIKREFYNCPAEFIEGTFEEILNNGSDQLSLRNVTNANLFSLGDIVTITSIDNIYDNVQGEIISIGGNIQIDSPYIGDANNGIYTKPV